MTRTRLRPAAIVIAAASLLLAALPPALQAQEAKMKPLCKMTDADVRQTVEGWAGPNCTTIDPLGRAVVSAKPADRSGAKTDGKPKPLCRPNDIGVKATPGGWEGPDCMTSEGFGKSAQ